MILSFDRINAGTAPREHRTSAVAYHAPAANATLVLAHGAGAGQQSSFIVEFARGLAARGVDTLTFNFVYTEERRRLPDRTDVLEACYRGALALAREHFGRDRVYIGGKSMGGGIATHPAAADDAEDIGVAGVVALGYPLHPPGTPAQLRTAHLPRIRVPVLVVQGERDPFGGPDELRAAIEAMTAPVTLHVVERGDHSLAPSRRKEVVEETYRGVQDAIAAWMARVAA